MWTVETDRDLEMEVKTVMESEDHLSMETGFPPTTLAWPDQREEVVITNFCRRRPFTGDFVYTELLIITRGQGLLERTWSSLTSLPSV